MTHVQLLKKKDEAEVLIPKYDRMMERQTGTKVKVIRTDGGGEFINGVIDKYTSAQGIKHEVSVSYVHEQHGVSERTNRWLEEMATAMMLRGNLPVKFWGDAIATAAYIKNRSVHSTLLKAGIA